MNGVATIDKIRTALRALHDAIEAKGLPGQSYSLNVGVAFPPAQRLSAEEVKEGVEGNKNVSANLHYGLQAIIGGEAIVGATIDSAKTHLRKFEQELANLPQELAGRMSIEFVVENKHEKEIVEDAQSRLNASLKISEDQAAAKGQPAGAPGIIIP